MNNYVYILLQIIKENASLDPLISSGLTYKDIGDLMEVVFAEKYIIQDNTSIKLTESGIEFLAYLEKKRKNRNKNEWIEVDKRSKIAKIDKKFIYLPDQNDLWFD